MYSMTRVFIGVAIYLVYLFGIIGLLMVTGDPIIFLILLFVGVGVFVVTINSRWLITSGKYQRLMQNGADADATVVAMSDTGVTVNQNPYVNLQLRVQPAGRPAYDASMKVLVSRLAIPRVGETIRVKYDPNKPQDVIVP